ncbi:hypothetical protein TNCV_1798721 [Trichonephila clavipes]|uniref:Uncharacterized protein n=1 Tax=Trichonephila clavipes TaxID=2585209 RepID=A0A8X6SJN4_TRICX|nr:hypothetical protein TNCV_1798721 [Trichonephila clavipes]
MSRLFLTSPASKVCPTSGDIILPNNTFPPRAASATLLSARTFYSDRLHEGGNTKNCVSSIVCLDKKAPVSQEVNKSVMTTKLFSQTVHMCYASGTKGDYGDIFWAYGSRSEPPFHIRKIYVKRLWAVSC